MVSKRLASAVLVLIAVLMGGLDDVLAEADSVCEPGNTKDIRLLRNQAAHRHRRIIQNNDGCDAWFYCNDSNDESLLKVWTKGLENSKVSTIFYTTQTGIGTVTHNSKIAAPMTLTTGAFKDNKLQGFLDRGTDPLKIVSTFCRRNNLEIFASFRMNDIHSGDLEPNGRMCDPELHSPWKSQHPEYLLGERGGKRVPYFGQSRAWAAANYELLAVRDYVYRTIEEVCINYDIDGIELDFFRHPLFFKSHVWQGKTGQSERAIMTEFVGRIRTMLDREALKRGHALLLAVRVPDSTGFCSDIGLDLEVWLRKGLIDIVIPGGYFQLQPWEETIELGHRFGIPVYPCLDDSRDIDEPSEHRLVRNSAAAYRGRALQAWNNGADGVYLFNAIYLFKPDDTIYDQLGDPNVLRHQSQAYFVNVLRTDIIDGFLTGASRRYLKLPELTKYRPMLLNYDEVKRISLDIGAQPGTKALLKINVEGINTSAEIAVTLNSKAVGQGQLLKNWITVVLGKDDMKQGVNWFSIRNKSKNNIKVLDLQLWINPQ